MKFSFGASAGYFSCAVIAAIFSMVVKDAPGANDPRGLIMLLAFVYGLGGGFWMLICWGEWRQRRERMRNGD